MKRPSFEATASALNRLAKTADRAEVEAEIEALRDILALRKEAPQGTYLQEMVNCGKKKCRRCNGGTTAGHGPYWYHYRVENGKTVKKYIGKEMPVLA